jgi:pimeloyl-ACP methyl ester carboxylesterase
MAQPQAMTDVTGASLREATTFLRADDGQKLALTEMRRGCEEPGAGAPAFLLLHGFAQNRLAYTLGDMPAALLDRGARVFLGELRGHGDSKVRRGKRWTMEHHLDHDCPTLIRGVRDQARVERIHLVGHSMGGLLGCAMLGRGAHFASFTAAATPILLGANRPLVRIASFFVGPFATLAPKPNRVPMDAFLRALSTPLAAADARGPIWALQKLTRLANPHAAEPAAVRRILAHADRESPAVFEALAANAVLRRPKLCDVDLVSAVRDATCPIAGISGTQDIFAPRAAMSPLEAEGQKGPRVHIDIVGGSHIDSIMGYHVRDTVDRLWDFWMQES